MNVFNEEVNIENLIKYAKEERLWLPEFQRPFVWELEQIRLLVDSLYHNYTISSILLWEGGDVLARRRVGGGIHEIKIPEEKEGQRVVYLLDGQQRTTALMLTFTNKDVFKGRNKKKKETVDLYFDSEYQGSDPELRWVFGSENVDHPVDPEQKLQLGALEQPEIFQLFRTRFVKLKHAFESDDQALLAAMNKDAQLFVEYNAKIKELTKKILGRKVYEIEQMGTLEQVLEVFERINTKNTKLNIFDIMVAKTYRKFPQGFFDLRSFYEQINFEGDVTADYFKNQSTLDYEGIEGVLEDSDMLFLTLIMLKKEFKASEIIKLTTQDLIQDTKRLHDEYHRIVGFMDNEFHIAKEELWKYQPAMKFLAAAITHFGKLTPAHHSFLKTWFWNTLLKNRYPGAQNARIERDFKMITPVTDLQKVTEAMKRDNTRSFKDLIGRKVQSMEFIDASYEAKNQQLYRAMMLLLKSKGARDFHSGFPPAKSGAAAYRLDEHHIFPTNSKVGKAIREKFADSRHADILNNVANIALLTQETNRKWVINQNPSVYIPAFEAAYQKEGKLDEFRSIMASQFITAEMLDLLKSDSFEEFMVARTTLLATHMETLCN